MFIGKSEGKADGELYSGWSRLTAIESEQLMNTDSSDPRKEGNTNVPPQGKQYKYTTLEEGDLQKSKIKI